MELSVIVPVHNEAQNITQLVADIENSLASADHYEIIFVDDGSTDDTLKILKTHVKRLGSRLRIVHHRHRCGQSTAIRSGVLAANFSVIATLDGDRQNDPADIPRLWQLFQERRSQTPALWMIAGYRKSRDDSAWRRLSSKLANAIRAYFLRDNTPDSACGLKLFLRDQYLLLPYFDHMHRFLPALVLRAGGQVISEPVNHRKRMHGNSKYGTLDRLFTGVIDLLGVMWLNKRAKLAETEEIVNG